MKNIVTSIVVFSFFAQLGFAKDADWKLYSEYDISTKKVGAKLKAVLGKTVTTMGFMIPIESDTKKIKEFLLVPYFPSCMHVPPPAENQIIKVKMTKPVELSYYPVKVTGKIMLEKGKQKPASQFMPSGVFSMDGSKMEIVKE